MNTSWLQSRILGGAMLLSGGLAKMVTPTTKLSDSRPPMVLAEAIPSKFGDWEEDREQVSAVVNPTAAAEIARIYAQTLSRTYVNKDGERIMLSIAYGTDQSDNLSVHFPEGCYVGQGFAIGATTRGGLDTSVGKVPVARLVASMNSRNEPITYWVVVGDKAVDSSWEMKKVKLKYALRGEIPDATLMRVSNITGDVEHGYRLQQQFVSAMLASMKPDARYHFSGQKK